VLYIIAIYIVPMLVLLGIFKYYKSRLHSFFMGLSFIALPFLIGIWVFWIDDRTDVDSHLKIQKWADLNAYKIVSIERPRGSWYLRRDFWAKRYIVTYESHGQKHSIRAIIGGKFIGNFSSEIIVLDVA
jgi:hypothetical protein